MVLIEIIWDTIMVSEFVQQVTFSYEQPQACEYHFQMKN